MLGLTVGALAAGTLVQYGPAPRTLCYLIILALLTVCSVLLLFAPETVKRQPGFLQSLIPHFSMPHSNRRLYPIAASIFVATWGLGGFYQAFGPSIASEQLGSHNTLTAALVFSAIMVPSAFGGPLNKFLHPVGAQRLGIVLFTISLGGILIALKISSISLFLTTSVFAGFGQGITLTGSIRTLLEDIPSEERASILSLIYATSYTGAAVPSFIAGQLSHYMNLFEIALCYGLLAISACAITLIFTENRKEANNAASYST